MESRTTSRLHKPETSKTDSAEDDDDWHSDVPLHRMRPFGSGLKRKPITFVPASDGDLNTSEKRTSQPNPPQDVGALYLSLVLPGERSRSEPPGPEKALRLCSVCNTPLAAESPEAGVAGDEKEGRVAAGIYPKSRGAHEASIAHQVCLAHSHPPSALDRTRLGLSYLESHGWDPDSRAGLGASHQGIQFPLKPKPKDDRLGVGRDAPTRKEKKEKTRLLDAGKVRKMAEKDRRKTEILRRQLCSSQDLEKYLGPGCDG